MGERETGGENWAEEIFETIMAGNFPKMNKRHQASDPKVHH